MRTLPATRSTRSQTRSPSACENPYCSCDPCRCATCACGVAKLSNFERRLMDDVWESPGAEVTVRDVASGFPDYAYTTVATVLDRLVVKGVLTSRLVGRTKRYLAVGSRGAHTAVLMHDALAADRDPDAALRRFAGALTTSQADIVRRTLDAAERRSPQPSAHRRAALS